jgi:hypothetical protein
MTVVTEERTRTEKHRGLLAMLESSGLLDYGCSFPADLVREYMEIECPKVGTRQQFNDAALAELSAIDYVRNVLLGRGMYLTSDGDSYRILLPSENKMQIERYISSADHKLRRAQKLSRNTPRSGHAVDNTDARIYMKRESVRRHSAPNHAHQLN